MSEDFVRSPQTSKQDNNDSTENRIIGPKLKVVDIGDPIINILSPRLLNSSSADNNAIFLIDTKIIKK